MLKTWKFEKQELDIINLDFQTIFGSTTTGLLFSVKISIEIFKHVKAIASQKSIDDVAKIGELIDPKIETAILLSNCVEE